MEKDSILLIWLGQGYQHFQQLTTKTPRRLVTPHKALRTNNLSDVNIRLDMNFSLSEHYVEGNVVWPAEIPLLYCVGSLLQTLSKIYGPPILDGI